MGQEGSLDRPPGVLGKDLFRGEEAKRGRTRIYSTRGRGKTLADVTPYGIGGRDSGTLVIVVGPEVVTVVEDSRGRGERTIDGGVNLTCPFRDLTQTITETVRMRKT